MRLRALQRETESADESAHPISSVCPRAAAGSCGVARRSVPNGCRAGALVAVPHPGRVPRLVKASPGWSPSPVCSCEPPPVSASAEPVVMGGEVVPVSWERRFPAILTALKQLCSSRRRSLRADRRHLAVPARHGPVRAPCRRPPDGERYTFEVPGAGAIAADRLPCAHGASRARAHPVTGSCVPRSPFGGVSEASRDPRLAAPEKAVAAPQPNPTASRNETTCPRASGSPGSRTSSAGRREPSVSPRPAAARLDLLPSAARASPRRPHVASSAVGAREFVLTPPRARVIGKDLPRTAPLG